MVNQDPNDIRAQLLASLQERMAPVAQPDVSQEQNAALMDRAGSGTVRAGTQLANAFMGRQSNGDNNFSQNLDDDAKQQLAAAMEKKRMAVEMDKRREELRNGLSTRFVDDENQRAQFGEKTRAEVAASEAKNKFTHGENAADRANALAIAGLKHKEDGQAKAEAKIQMANDKSQQTLGKDLGPMQDTLNAIGEVEQALGAPLEKMSYDKDGNATKDGKVVNLPGVNFPGVGPVSFFSQEARNLDDTMARVFNQTLKIRSGAAVTDNELARLRGEFSAGKFNTEAEKVKALQDVKRLLHQSFSNTEAKYKPAVVNEYKERGGQTAGDVAVPMRPGQAPGQPAGPAVGTEEDGHIFMGGDPSKPENWKTK